MKIRRRRLARAKALQVETLEHRRLLAVLTVNSELDNLISGDGLVTLREAIIAANENSTTDLGQTGSERDRIVFDPAIDGTPIVLSIEGTGEDAALTGDLDITDSDLIIFGNGRDQTIIDANSIDRVFDVQGDAPITFENLMLTGGRAEGRGGAIRGGQVTVIDSLLAQNFGEGGGIFTDGSVHIVRSNVLNNLGGGVYGESVSVEESSISDNRAGGIKAIDTIELRGSLISGNRGPCGSGGGLDAGGDITVVASTISGNSNDSDSCGGGAGGIYSRSGNILVAESTVWGNHSANSGGGGISIGCISHGCSPPTGLLTLESSIVAGNTMRALVRYLQEFRVPNVMATNSFIGVSRRTGLAESREPDENGNIIGATEAGVWPQRSTLDPLLGPLQDNGGPTWTHALLPGSPAIDAGARPSRHLTDQRGFSRDVGHGPDIGAFERQETYLTVNSELDNIIPGDNLVTLREAIIAANTDSTTDLGDKANGEDLIVIDRSLDTKMIRLSIPGEDEDNAQTGDLDITDPAGLRITGSATSESHVDANLFDRVFDIQESSGPVTIERLSISGGSTNGNDLTDGGGAIRSLSHHDVLYRDGTISNNASKQSGGGIYSVGNVAIENSTVSQNRANQGGGIYSVGNVAIENTTVSQNRANQAGGVFAARSVSLDGTTVSENFALQGGGVVAMEDVFVSRSNITANSSQDLAGGITGRDVRIVASSIIDNRSDRQTGGIRGSGEVIIDRSTVSGNSGQVGGGIQSGGDVRLVHATISGNEAKTTGGGVDAAGTITANNSTVTNNSAASGGGLAYGHHLNLFASIVAQNVAGDNPDLHRRESAFVDSQYTIRESLIGNSSGTPLEPSQQPDPNGNLIGSSASPIDPRLGPLQDNGGSALTHNLLFGSPALDAVAEPGVRVIDQRGAGFRRKVGTATDMGAVELQGVYLTVNSAEDNPRAGDGLVTLREAIMAANNDTTTDLGETADGGDFIIFDRALDGQTITLSIRGLREDANQKGDFDITDPAGLSIIGNGSSRTIIDGKRIDRIFDATRTSGPVLIQDVTLTGGWSIEGGAIRSDRNHLKVIRSQITGNSADRTFEEFMGCGCGGGISANHLHIVQSTVSDNRARNSGGGIAGRDVLVQLSTISGNTSGFWAGGIESKNITLEFSTVTENSARNLAGAIGGTDSIVLVSSIIGENQPEPTSTCSHPHPHPSECNPTVPFASESFMAKNSLISINAGSGLRSSRTPDANGNLIGTRRTPLDPLLGPLRDNGGPTLTHSLLPGSPAIDAGGTTLPLDEHGRPIASDQRGASYPRIVGEQSDIGALEVQHLIVGDSNHDQVFDALDLLAVLQAGKYQDGIPNNATFEEGDWNRDGDFDAADIIFALQFGNYTSND